MKSQEERREERRQYENDVFYEVWRRGSNPDRIDYDRVDDSRQDGLPPEAAAQKEISRMQPRPAPQEQQEFEE